MNDRSKRRRAPAITVPERTVLFRLSGRTRMGGIRIRSDDRRRRGRFKDRLVALDGSGTGSTVGSVGFARFRAAPKVEPGPTGTTLPARVFFRREKL